MSVTARFWNFVKGLFWVSQQSLEQANPDIVYEMAIRKMKSKYTQLRTAVARLAAERNRLRGVVKEKTALLADVERDLNAALLEAEAGIKDAIELGEDLVAERDAVQGELEVLRGELFASERLVAEYLGKLRQIESRTKAMESKRDAMLAKLKSAEARKSFADMVSGMSTSAEEAAVSDIDRYIERQVAEADVADELSGATRAEKRRKLRQSARQRQSASKFQAMLEARKTRTASPLGRSSAKVGAGKTGIG